MKKIVLFVIAASFILIPAIVKAECRLCKEKFGIQSVERFDDVNFSTAKKDTVLSTTVHLTMLDGNEFFIPVKVGKNFTATLEFASGKTAIVTPWGVSVVEGTGYQQFDNVQNNVDFMGTYVDSDCIIDLILCFGFGAFIVGLIFCYFAYQNC